MAKHANELRNQIIKPALEYLGADSKDAEALLLSLALLAARYRSDDDRLGIYQISPLQHRQIWDDYLAFHPDLASEIRALASQRWFLENPDRELIANLAYATAIAWMLFSISGQSLPAATDLGAQVRVWLRIFGPKEGDEQLCAQATDWLGGRLQEVGHGMAIL
jgi:hypothetical protein